MLVFLRKNTRIHTKMGEIHELFVLAPSLVWFAGATPEKREAVVSQLRYGECTHEFLGGVLRMGFQKVSGPA